MRDCVGEVRASLVAAATADEATEGRSQHRARHRAWLGRHSTGERGGRRKAWRPRKRRRAAAARLLHYVDRQTRTVGVPGLKRFVVDRGEVAWQLQRQAQPGLLEAFRGPWGIAPALLPQSKRGRPATAAAGGRRAEAGWAGGRGKSAPGRSRAG